EMNAQALEITAQATQTCIGMFTSADRNSQFVGEVWTRDAALACAVFGRFDPQMAVETFTTILSHAQPSGRLPLRVEYVRHWANYVPPLRRLKRMGIDLITRPEAHAVYNNVRFSLPARDSASALIVSCGELFDHSAEVRKFVEDNWTFLLRSLNREARFSDLDGLIKGRGLQDWADSLIRKGKLAYVNALYYQAVHAMSHMAAILKREDDAELLRDQAITLKHSYLRVFWDEEAGYVKAAEDDNRLDTAANIFASLYLLTPEQAVRAQEKIRLSTLSPCGLLRNFDRPYPASQVALRYRAGRISSYHNSSVWPWVTTLNIQAKLDIARKHSDPLVRQRFLKEAWADFDQVTALHAKNGGEFYEVLHEQSGNPLHSRWLGITLYHSSPGFMASAATYILVGKGLQKFGRPSPEKTLS
ncbi:MAG TPA: amylo-alpha-1,6-glucosidase, partial [Verrucomicrobiae bacterium]|nr:amylo-alpha-1,6-glucosidase [Verrucomicrobiae bacterium]